MAFTAKTINVPIKLKKPVIKKAITLLPTGSFQIFFSVLLFKFFN